LLFFPWRNEELDLCGTFKTYEDHFNHVRTKVVTKVIEYEYHAEELDLAQQQAQDDLSEQFDNIAPSTQHNEAEDCDENSRESQQFIYFKPGSVEHKDYDIGIDLGTSQSIPNVESSSSLMLNTEYLKLVRSLILSKGNFSIMFSIGSKQKMNQYTHS